jgi:hypothetical protein
MHGRISNDERTASMSHTPLARAASDIANDTAVNR